MYRMTPPDAKLQQADSLGVTATAGHYGQYGLYMQEEYPACVIEPRAPPPPAPSKRSPVKFTGTSTNASEYVPHAIDPRAVRPPSA